MCTRFTFHAFRYQYCMVRADVLTLIDIDTGNPKTSHILCYEKSTRYIQEIIKHLLSQSLFRKRDSGHWFFYLKTWQSILKKFFSPWPNLFGVIQPFFYNILSYLRLIYHIFLGLLLPVHLHSYLSVFYLHASNPIMSSRHKFVYQIRPFKISVNSKIDFTSLIMKSPIVKQVQTFPKHIHNWYRIELALSDYVNNV